MGIQVNGSHVHWNYLVALEQDLAKVSRFIEFSEANFSTYSIELAHLLLAVSSEVDVVLKALCNLKNPVINHKNINQYRSTVKEHLPHMIKEKCFIHRYGIELEPWSNWLGEENPMWWRSYNMVKHQRNEHFDKANLKNTLNALAALSVAVLYYYKELFSQDEPLEFRDVTIKLKPETSLIEFSEDYVYHNLMLSQ